MSDPTLIREKNEEIVELTQKLHDLQELVGSLIVDQAQGLEEIEATEGRNKIEKVYQHW